MLFFVADGRANAARKTIAMESEQNENEWVEDFLSYQMAQRGASPRTVATYQVALKYSEAFFVREKGGAVRWSLLKTEDFRAWEAEQMRRGYAPAYVRKNMSALRSFYRFLLREQRVAADPVRQVKTPKIPRRLPTFVREEEMDRLFEWYPFGDGYIGRRDYTILLLLYHTGMRSAEMLAMDGGDVSMEDSSVRVTGKGNRQRVIPFGPELAEALSLYIKEWKAFLGCTDREAAGLPLFVNHRRRRMTYAELRQLVRDALGAVTTQKKRSPHVLRHSFATAMLAHGAQLEAIQQLLGHASVATTAIYTHTTVAELREQYHKAHPRNEGEN